jgi:hypothetical protein
VTQLLPALARVIARAYTVVAAVTFRSAYHAAAVTFKPTAIKKFGAGLRSDNLCSRDGENESRTNQE